METLKQAASGKNFMRNLMAVILVIGSFVTMLIIYSHPAPNGDQGTRTQIITFCIATITLVGGYYFVSSQSSTDKNETIDKQLNEKKSS